VLREVRPQVVVGYDEHGGYGHPDHIQAHRVTMLAVDAAADAARRPDLGAPHAVAKVYWTCVPVSVLQEGLDALAAADTGYDGVTDAREIPFAAEDADVTCEIDGAAHRAEKAAAMAAHATQLTMDGEFYALSNNLGQEVLTTEHYRLVRGARGPGVGEQGWETDLFAGL
jgi:N-acetyl-1-D-myo-inositol-2-amino-2-deoxy-alpha-D-glucopyranoside deacetylase